jgi:AcrR family transcriptional regulator
VTAAPDGTADRIVSAAALVFEERGYAGASTRALAAAAGCNVATLAYHFGHKEGLYHAVLDAQYARLLALPLPAVLPGDPASRVRALVAVIHGFLRRERSALRLLTAHTLLHGRHPEAVLARWHERYVERLAAVQLALGIPLEDRQLALVSLGQLLARYALTDPTTLTPYVEGDVEPAVVAHLGDVAVRLLLGPAR